MVRNPDDINPNWKRPANWKYKEDWGSPNWEKRMEETFKNINEKRRKYGFKICPKCGTEHTNLTLTCRECMYQPTMEQDVMGAEPT
jgi:hypothetical protein